MLEGAFAGALPRTPGFSEAWLRCPMGTREKEAPREDFPRRA